MKDPARDYPELHAARVMHLPDSNPTLYVLSRYEDVRDALNNSRAFSTSQGTRPRPGIPNSLQSESPNKTSPRAILQASFSQALINRAQDSAAVKAIDLLAQLDARSNWDLHDDFALPLSIDVLGRVIGIPAKELELFQYYGEIYAAASLVQDPIISNAHWNEDLHDFSKYLLSKIIEIRQSSHRGGVIGALIDASARTKEVSDHDILQLVNHLLTEGLETSATMMTNALWRVLPDRKLWQDLGSTPGRVQSLINESLRFDPPTLALFRTATQTVSDYGKEIPQGGRVMLHLGAANRDPAIFYNPNRFIADRPDAQHVTFGLGIHYCPGAQVARAIAHAGVTTLSREAPQLNLRGQGERAQEFYHWGRRRLPVSSKSARV